MGALLVVRMGRKAGLLRGTKTQRQKQQPAYKKASIEVADE